MCNYVDNRLFITYALAERYFLWQVLWYMESSSNVISIKLPVPGENHLGWINTVRGVVYPKELVQQAIA